MDRLLNYNWNFSHETKDCEKMSENHLENRIKIKDMGDQRLASIAVDGFPFFGSDRNCCVPHGPYIEIITK